MAEQQETFRPREMTGAELKSMLKSSIHFKSLGGMKCPGLKLSEEDLKWWRDAKFGMFIHWGLYSVLGRGEWAMHNEGISVEDYAKIAKEDFCPQYSAEEIAAHWVKTAKDAGANYMVMVTRHHDGFALWDSPGSYNGFTSMNSKAKSDYVAAYAKACREAGLRVGVYYSPMDWRFPGYFQPRELLDNALLMKKQCHDQMEELVSRYGPIDIVWYDGGWLAHKGGDVDGAWLWDPVTLNQMVRRYNPKTVINPRSGWEGDFYCDEGSHEIKGKIIPVPWEKNMCICSGTSWGWIPNDPVMTLDAVVTMLVNVICRDGNLLLNVGPDKDGRIPAEAVKRMQDIGNWLAVNGEAVYKTRGGPFEPEDHVFGSTYRGNAVYIHVQDCQEFAKRTLPSLEQKILSCRTLDGTEAPFVQEDGGIRLSIPEKLAAQNLPDTIVKLTLDREIDEKPREEIRFTGK